MASNPGHEKSGKKKGHPISLLFSFLSKCGDCAIPIIGEKLAEKQTM